MGVSGKRPLMIHARIESSLLCHLILSGAIFVATGQPRIFLRVLVDKVLVTLLQTAVAMASTSDPTHPSITI